MALAHRCAASERLLRVIPTSRGAWMVGAPLARLLPACCRQVCLTLSAEDTTVQIEFDLTDPVQFAMLQHRHLDVGTAAVICALLVEGDTYIDVGANWGYFACIASHVVGTSGLVLAMEPNRDAFRRLQDTVHRNVLVNVLGVSFAASEEAGRHVSLKRLFFRQTTSSFVREANDVVPSGTVTNTVDYLCRKAGGRPARLLKVDVEGAELQVLKGARELLGDARPWVILEVSSYSRRFNYSPREVHEFMRVLGYIRAYAISDEPNRPVLSLVSDAAQGQILFQPAAQELPLSLGASP